MEGHLEEIKNQAHRYINEGDFTKLNDLLTDERLYKCNDAELYAIKAEIEETPQLALKYASSAIQINPDYWVGHFLSGKISFNIHDYTTAIKELNTAIEITPEHEPSLIYRAKAKEALNDFSGAIEDYTLALTINESNILTHYSRGNCYAALNMYRDAIEDYTRVIDNTNPDHDLFRRRADAYLRLNDFENAIANYSTAIDLDSSISSYFVNRSFALCQENQFEKAEADGTRAILMNPDNVEYRFSRGNIYLQWKHYIKAVDDFSFCIHSASDWNLPYYFRGFAYMELDEYQFAISDFNHSIRLGYTNKEVFRYRGYVLLELKQYRLAVLDFTHYLDSYSTNNEVRLHRAVSNCFLHEYELAIKDCSFILESDQNNFEAYNTRGNSFLEIGAIQLAINDFSVSIKLNRTDYLPFFSRGHAWMELKNFENAIDDYSKAIEVNTQDPDLYSHRGAAWYEWGNFNNAMNDFNTSIDYKVGCSHAYYGRGKLHKSLGRYEAAIDDFRASIEQNRFESYAYIPWGLLEWEMGNFSTALSLLLFGVKAKYKLNPFEFLKLLEIFTTIKPLLALRLARNYISIENYTYLGNEMDRLNRICRPVNGWLDLFHDQRDLNSERQFLKLSGIIKYWMGDPLTATEIFESLDDDSISDLQLQYYYFKTALEIHPEFPFKDETNSILKGVLAEVNEFLQIPSVDDENFYYACLILYMADDFEKVLEISKGSKKKSIHFLRIMADYMLGNSSLTESSSDNKVISQLINDFIIPEDVIMIDPDPALWKDQLSPVVKFYELEDILTKCEVCGPDIKRFYEIWDDKSLRDAIRLEKSRMFAEKYEELKSETLTIKSLKPNEFLVTDKIRLKFNDIKQSVSQNDLSFSESIALVISGKEISKRACLDFIDYFLSNGDITKTEAMYLILYANYVNDLLSEALFAGLEASRKSAFNSVFEDIVTSLFEIGSFLSCTTAGGLCALTIKLASKISFKGKSNEIVQFHEFKELFMKMVGATIEELGEETFYKQFPIGELEI